MPLYEYECQKCGQRIEEIQKFSDEPLKVHEGCGGDLRKLLSAPAIQFKGTGWYVTDYARAGKSDGGGPKSDGDSKKSDDKKTESKSEPKSETKSDSKSESKSSGSDSSTKTSSSSKD